MSLPIQLTIDLNEVIKKLASIILDAAHFNQDVRDSASLFKQEIGAAEFLVGVANHRLLNSPLGSLQKEAIETTFDNLKRCHDELTRLIIGDHEPGSDPNSVTGASLAVRSFASPAARRIRWAMGRKSTASKILRDIRQSSDYLRRSLLDLELANSQILSIPENATNSTQAGLSTQRRRLGIRRGRIPPDKNILRHLTFLDQNNNSPLEDGGSIRTAIYAGSYPVLVESIQVGAFDDTSERRAMQLAMLLSQPRMAGFNVLKCEGLVKNEPSNKYEFIFDVGGIITDLKEDKISSPSPSELFSNFRSLNFHLSRQPDKDRTETGNGDSHDADCARVFRYSKIGIDKCFRPITLLERLMFARSLAQTLSTLHLADWVHGDITSRNVLFFQDLDRGVLQPEDCSAAGAIPFVTRLGSPYVFGFQFMRLSDEFSNQWGWGQVTARDNVYRHPERQINRSQGPEKRHTPLHDIYSLGVIFLEIGLGQSAEDLLRIGKRSWQKMAMASVSSAATPDNNTVTSGTTPTPQRPALSSQAVFLDLAYRLLPERMGESFAQITRLCLSGEVRTTSHSQSGERDDLAETPLENEVTLSAAFWSCVVEPLDELINAMSVI